MKLKRIMAMVLCVAMVLSSMSFSVFAEGESAKEVTGDYVASIGEQGYETLQAAIDAVQNENTIVLLKECAEDVIVVQTPDIAFTIDGNYNTISGTITIDGKSAAYATAGLTIENVNFDATSINKDASINFGGTNDTRYISNVTVKNCIFTGEGNVKVGIKSYTGGDKNLTITGCKATGMHSLAQLKNVAGVTVTECNIEGKSGISLGASHDVVVSNCVMTLSNYGVRADAIEEGAGVEISDCEINAFIPVVVRNVAENYDLAFSGTNTMTASNTDNIWCAIGATEYENNGEMPDAPETGKVDVTLDDGGLNVEGIYDAANATEEETSFVAAIGEQGYTTLQSALDAAVKGETTTIKILDDHEVDVNVLQYNMAPVLVNGKDIILDLNGKTITFDWEKKTVSTLVYTSIYLANGAKLTVIDTSEEQTGTLYNKYAVQGNDGPRIIWTTSACSTIIEGGRFISEQGDTMFYTSNSNKDIPSTLTINNGYFEHTIPNAGDGYRYFNKQNGYQKQIITINGGKFKHNPTDSEVEFGEGFKVEENADGSWGVVSVVAKVGDEEYTSLSEAMEAANEIEDGAVVVLLCDVEIGEKFTISSDVTISGEHTITRADEYTGTLFAVSEGATLTLDGGLVIDGANEWTLNEELYNKALNLEVSGVTWADLITSEEGAPNATAPMFKVTGSVVANDVTIQNNYSDKSSNNGDYGVFQVDANASLTMTGATVKHIVTGGANSVAHLSTDSVWIINDGSLITDTFAGKNGGVCRNDSGKLVMNGGEITNNNSINTNGTVVMLYKGSMEMNGGKICSNTGISGANNGRCAPIYGHSTSTFVMNDGEICHNTGISYGGVDVPSSIKVEINGGYVGENISSLGNTNADVNGNSNTVINGGTFTQDVTQWLTPDSGLVYNEETGTYGLTQKLYEYNGVAYKTFAEVIEKIKATPATLADDNTAPVVKVLASHRPSATIAIDTNIILDLNGKNLYGVTGVNPIIRVLADVTITGNGMIDSANHGDGYCFIVGSSNGSDAGNLTIENGTFKGTTTAVSVTKGTATILDGDFRVKPYNENIYDYLLNCIDANYNDGSAKIIVKGGKFTKFNPANNAAEGANTNFVAPGNMVVDNGDETWNVIGMVAMIGETGFATLTEAIKTAQANDTIKLIANIKENVTINKNLTIDGADKQYTGTMALNASNITVQNLNIVGGNIIKGNNTAASANITIKNCDFDGQMANVYAVELRATNKIVIEDCTAKDYGYGFLQVPKSNNTISVKNVDISGVNYGFKIDYSNGVTLENVTVTDARVAGILDSNYGTKTYTIMNCTITGESPVGVWDRKTGKIDTFIFAGTNDFGTKEFKIGEQATLKLAGTDAVLKACEGLTVTSTNEIYSVVYEDGAYKVQKVAKVGENHYYSLQEAIDAANDGDIITLVADIKTVQNVTINKNVVVDLNGHTVNGAILPSNGDITVKNGWIKNTDNGQSAIEINSGKLNLTNVNIESARHAIRIDGDVQAVIDGGTYKVVPVDGKTVHAINVSGNANVVIKNGEFIGPKGTVADSGAAVNVQAGSTVTIEGGTFTGGKNNTLASKDTLTVKGGVFDQDPSTYVADGYKTSDKANNFYVVYPEFKVSAIVNDADKTVKAGEKFEVYITVTGGDYTNAGWKLGYDPTKVEYVKAQDGVEAVDYAIVDSVLGEGQTSGNEYKNGEVYKKYTFRAKYPSTTVNSVFTIENVYVNNYEMAAWLDKTPAAMEGDTITITNDLAFGGTIADKEVSYNGMYQKGEAFVANMDGAVVTYSTEENGNYTTEVPAFKDAGEHTYYYKATLAGYTTVTGSAKLTITPATLAPKAEFNVDPDYDTVKVKAVIENLIDNSFKGTVTIEVDGQKVTFEATEFTYDGNGRAIANQFKKVDLTEGKEYAVKVTYTANAAGDNYASAESETKVNPDKKDITSDDLNGIKAALTNSYVYDGAKHYVKVDEANLPGEWKVEIPEIGLTDVGETMVTIKATDASGKYNEHTFNVVLKVTPKDITIVINNASKDLGQADPVFTSNIDELLVAADHLGEVKYVREPGEAIGTYKINVTYTPNPNYNVVDIVEGNLYIGAPTDFKVEVVNNKLLKGDGYKQDYIAGYRLVLVYTNVDKAYFTYKGQEMYDVSDAAYKYYDYDFTTMTATKDDTDYKHIYAIVVEAEYGYEDTAENEAMYANNVEFASETAKSEKILYNSDINYTGELDVEDFSITNGVYNVLYRGKAFITRLLKADVNGNKLVDTEDARMIKEVVVK